MKSIPKIIDDQEWSKMRISEKLRHYINTPPLSYNKTYDYAVRNNFWADILGIHRAAHNKEVDKEIIAVLEQIIEGRFFPEGSYEKSIFEILRGAGICQYWGRPLRERIDYDLLTTINCHLVPKAIERWRKDYQVK